MMRDPNRFRLNQDDLNKAKLTVFQDLQASSLGAAKSRAALCLERFDYHDYDDMPEARLRGFVYLATALSENAKRLSFTPTQIQDTFEKAYTRLGELGIRPGTSKLSYLYADIYQFRSLCQRKMGAHWDALWSQVLAVEMSHEVESEIDLHHRLSLANRHARLGHTAEALLAYTELEGQMVGSPLRQQLMLSLCRALRLSKKWDQAERRVVALIEESQGEARQEFEWEHICLECSKKRDWSKMSLKLKPYRSHFHPSYVIEGFLWIASSQQKNLLSRAPNLEALRRNRRLSLTQTQLFYEIALAIDRCYNTQIPLPERLESLGAALTNRRQLLTIDKELLVLTAAYRWLYRVSSLRLCKIVLGEYERLSLSITAGQDRDCLDLVTSNP